jgi:hypothetical protein
VVNEFTTQMYAAMSWSQPASLSGLRRFSSGSGRMVGNPYLGITSGLLVIPFRQELGSQKRLWDAVAVITGLCDQDHRPCFGCNVSHARHAISARDCSSVGLRVGSVCLKEQFPPNGPTANSPTEARDRIKAM